MKALLFLLSRESGNPVFNLRKNIAALLQTALSGNTLSGE